MPPASSICSFNNVILNCLYFKLIHFTHPFVWLLLCLTCATESKPSLNDDQIPIASNITLVLLKWFPPAVKVSWCLNETYLSNLHEMQIFYNPVKSNLRNMIRVKPEVRQVTLNKLQPHQEYELEIVSVAFNTKFINSSSSMNFISPSNESSFISKFSYYTPYSQEEIKRKLRITMDEIIILLVVLIFWLTVICIFCSKWSKLRHLEPYHPDYRPSHSIAQHSPVYSVDSDDLAGVGALTTTPVALGGGLSELDENDSFILVNKNDFVELPTDLIDNANPSNLHNVFPYNPLTAYMPVTGTSLFAHSPICHLETPILPVCPLEEIVMPDSTLNLAQINPQIVLSDDLKQESSKTNKDCYATANSILSDKLINVEQIKKQVQFLHKDVNLTNSTFYKTCFSLPENNSKANVQNSINSKPGINSSLVTCENKPSNQELFLQMQNVSNLENHTTSNIYSTCSIQNNGHLANSQITYTNSLPKANSEITCCNSNKPQTAEACLESIFIELPTKYYVQKSTNNKQNEQEQINESKQKPTNQAKPAAYSLSRIKAKYNIKNKRYPLMSFISEEQEYKPKSYSLIKFLNHHFSAENIFDRNLQDELSHKFLLSNNFTLNKSKKETKNCDKNQNFLDFYLYELNNRTQKTKNKSFTDHKLKAQSSSIQNLISSYDNKKAFETAVNLRKPSINKFKTNSITNLHELNKNCSKSSNLKKTISTTFPLSNSSLSLKCSLISMLNSINLNSQNSNSCSTSSSHLIIKDLNDEKLFLNKYNQMHQSATMFNLSSNNQFVLNKKNQLNKMSIQIRRCESTEQMLKRFKQFFISNIRSLYKQSD